MPYAVNSRALTGQKPCINKESLALMMRRKTGFNMIVPGPLNLFRHAPFIGDGAIKLVVCYLCFCNGPIKTRKKETKEKKKGLDRALNPDPLGHSAAFYHYARAACTRRQYKCILDQSLLKCLHDVIISLYLN